MQYFYAYHGPQNEQDFNPAKGYGVSSKAKYEQVNDGDRVFIIQHLKGKTSAFYLCGEYEITGHLIKSSARYPYRFELKEVSNLNEFIILDPIKLNNALPQKDGDYRLNNFQRHFCSQGNSFRAPLTKECIDVFNSILDSTDIYTTMRKRREDGLRMVKVRRDQKIFRIEVLDNWHGKCAVTGSSLAVEACHIISHANKGNPCIENGIALAADLHNLFDSDDLSFVNNKVILSERAQNEERYKHLHNIKLRTPKSKVTFPKI